MFPIKISVLGVLFMQSLSVQKLVNFVDARPTVLHLRLQVWDILECN